MASRDKERRVDTFAAKNAQQAPRLAEGATLAGRYRLGALLNDPSPNQVFAAMDRQVDDLPVVVEVLPNWSAENERAAVRLRDAVMVAMGLTHPNIVDIRDFQTDGCWTFLVMERLDGPALDTLVDEHGPLPMAEVRAIARDAGAALSYGHDNGVCHRAVRASKLLYHGAGDDRIVKVTGFCVAHEVADTTKALAGVERIEGLAYVAPEQLEGYCPDARSDQYALAASLYELLSGRPPFLGDDQRKRIRSALPRPVDGVSARANTALLKALAKKPDDRFSSVSAFCTAFMHDDEGAGTPGAADHPAAIVVDRSSPVDVAGATTGDATGSRIPTVLMAGLIALFAAALVALAVRFGPGPGAGDGRLELTTTPPGVKVFCVERGSNLLGSTDGTGLAVSLPAGDYSLSLVLQGYSKERRPVTIAAGRSPRVHVDMHEAP